MELRRLIAELPSKKGAAYFFRQGQITSHPYARIADDVTRVRRRLAGWGVRPGMRVGIYAPNSYDWLVHDLALIELGAISVPFTEDFAGQINEELLARYDVALLLIASAHAKLFPQKPAHVAFIDGDNGEVLALDRMPPAEGDSGDQHSLVFSSGSAGGLKGLVISRQGVEATLPPIAEALAMTPSDRLMMFLPMSNFQQRNMCYGALWYDSDIIITDHLNLFDAMKALDPTVLIGPPVLYQMVYAQFEKLPGWRRGLLSATGRVLSWIPFARLRDSAARSLFRAFRGQFGRRMRMLVTGMAPIRRNLGQFFETMQLPLSESYGMVEAGSITFRPPRSRAYGSVGKVLPGIRLSFEEDGEIIVHRDVPLTLRYFQSAPGENERTFIGAGKVATGDIGKLDDDGNLVLMGRKKELIITPGGYKVHPETIENEMNNCPDAGQSVVFLKPGASHLTCVVALAQPETDGARARVKKWAAALTSTKGAAQYVEVVFADAPFTRDNGMLRPNLKLDRKAIAARYG
jgi:long-subunit acyl-CoA synthetase (AMP-forming)